MGTDAYAHSGVLVHFSKVVDMLATALTPDDVIHARDRLIYDKELCERLAIYQAYLPVRESEEDDSKSHFLASDACALLGKVSSRAAFEHWMQLLCHAVVHGETGKYSECWVEDEEIIKRVVNVVASICGVSLPSFEVEVFGNARLTGLYFVEHGDLYFNFSVDECFEPVLTPTGKALASSLNETPIVSEWVSISY